MKWINKSWTKVNHKINKNSTPSDILFGIKREMSIYESTGVRTNEKMYKALLTIPPTSVEAERAFSALGFFVTKLRTRLKDNTIDNLCFLRAY